MQSGRIGWRRRRWAMARVLLVMAMVLVARVAEARMPRYLGPHPVAASVGGGWCELAMAHVHSYMPDRGALYVQTFDGLLFAADPTPFGYRGPRVVYYGHHPVPGHAKAFCYLGGLHHHGFEARGAGYRVVDGVAFWMEEMSDVYLRERAVREKAWEGMYREFAGMRPVVEVKVPEGWKGGGGTGTVSAGTSLPLPPSPSPSTAASTSTAKKGGGR